MSDENKEGIEPENASTQEPQAEPQAEPTEPTNPYKSIIDQQSEQINALIEQNNKLTEQITKMIQSGTQITQGNQQQSSVNAMGGFGKLGGALSDDEDYSVSALGKLIGKRE